MTLPGLLQGGIALVVTIVVLGVLVLVHELGHFVVARMSNIRVHEFGIGFPPRAKVLARRGETEYTLNYLPIGGFVKLEGEDSESADPRAFSNAPLLRQLIVLVAGVAMNLVTALVLFFLVAWLFQPVVGVEVTSVTPGSPAERAGIRAGDALDTIDGHRYTALEQGNILEALHGDAGKTVTIGYVDTSNRRQSVTTTLNSPTDVAAGKGALGILWRQRVTGYATTDPVSAARISADETVRALGLILVGLRDVVSSFVTNPARPPADVGGPIAIARAVNVTLWDLGPVYVLIVAAILSANLALVNIMPFPPLDGGRMAVLVIKRLIGARRVTAVESATYFVGFALLMLFILWISFFDIVGRPQ